VCMVVALRYDTLQYNDVRSKADEMASCIEINFYGQLNLAHGIETLRRSGQWMTVIVVVAVSGTTIEQLC